jgi:hypothetical protein
LIKVAQMKKLLSIFSIASVATILLANSASAEPIAQRGAKGIYTIDLNAGTYRGCLNSGGCISLGRKYLLPCKGTKETSYVCEGTVWKKGQYRYEVVEGMIVVTKNDRIIFEDSLGERVN